MLAALKQYGPVIGLLLPFVWWQSRKIDQLLDKNAAVYEAEITRMSQVQDRLLSRLIGEPASSAASPTTDQLRLGLNESEKKDAPSNE